jgi:uncharacterized membrane protein required for colicin V production
MALFDLTLFIIIAGFGLFGLWFGFIHTLGSLVGTIVGAFVAGRYYEPAADVLINITGWSDNLSRVFMFILFFLVVNRLVGFVFWIIEKTMRLAIRLPFLRSINRLLGGVLGIFEGLITVGISLYVMEAFPISENLHLMIEQSFIAPIALGISAILLPFFPEGLRLLDAGGKHIKHIFV